MNRLTRLRRFQITLLATALPCAATPAWTQVQAGTDTTAPAVQSQVPSTSAAPSPAGNSPASAAPDAPPSADGSPEAAPPTTATAGRGIGDIVVTAERHASSVQRTPAAITAVSGQDLAARNVTDISSLTSLVPSLHVNSYATGIQIGIRGVYAQSPSPSADPAVAFNIDGVYQARPASAAATFFDVNRVEVLRGPQGTLYGRNATGGSVNVITNRPTDHFEADFQGGVGNYGLMQMTGVVNTPIDDEIDVRAAVNYISHNGYTDNAPAKNGNDEDSFATRLQVLFKPTSNFDFRLSGSYNHEGGVGPAARLLTSTSKDFSFPLNTASNLDQTSYAISGEANWDIGPATITYIGAYSHLRYGYVYDGDFSATKNQVTTIAEREREITNELRISSNGGGKLQYVAGLYQFDEHSPYLQTQVQTPSVGHTLVLDAPQISAVAYAAYGQATYSLTDRLRITGGARFTYDKKTQEAAYLLDGVAITSNSGRKSWTAFNYKAGVEYDLTPRNMIYVNTSTAYKAGGINQSIPAATYGPEHLRAYVVGSKNRFFDNVVQINVEGFYYDYRDYQGALSLSTPSPVGPLIFNAVANAKKARLFGAEGELTFKLTRSDQIDGFVTYLNTKFLDYNIGTTDFTGHLLAKAPKWAATAGYQHVFDFSDGAKITARGEFHYESKQFLSPTNAITSFQPSYHESNAFVRYDAPNSKWFVNAWVRNIENDLHLTHVSLGAFINSPRTEGVTGGVRF
jgi:iron complex outermembrane receptor protein